METLNVFKIGGNIIEDEDSLTLFVKNFARIKGKKILIHGGGKTATSVSKQLNLSPKIIDGRRITDEKSLEVVLMVYAGLANKTVVAKLQANNCNALGLSGADGNLIQANKRSNSNIDYGFVGDFSPSDVNIELLQTFIENDLTPVFCAITHDKKGQLFNTNADTIAANIAISCSSYYQVKLMYCFEMQGVLRDVNNKDSIIKKITKKEYQDLKEQKIIVDGMIPKIDNCFYALENRVESVSINNAISFMDTEGTLLTL